MGISALLDPRPALTPAAAPENKESATRAVRQGARRFRFLPCAAVALIVGLSCAWGASGARAASGSVTATEGAQFSGQVGALTTSHCDTLTAGPNGTITWGDGQSSAESYTKVTGTFPYQFTVTGSHSYGEEGAYVGSVSSSYACTHPFTSSSSPSALASDTPLSAAAGKVSATAGQSFTGQLATIEVDHADTRSDHPRPRGADTSGAERNSLFTGAWRRT